MVLLEQELPPSNGQTYRWRGDMGLLDRLSYPNLDSLSRNWNMTILDYPPIKEHSQLLLCSPCPEEMSILAHSTAETERQETRKGNNIRSILPVTGLATELVQLPPKKKRYNIYII